MSYVWLVFISMSLVFPAYSADDTLNLLADIDDNFFSRGAPPAPDDLSADLDLLHDALADELPPLPPAQRFRIMHDNENPAYSQIIIAEYVASHDNQLHPCAVLRTPLSTTLYTAIATPHTAHWPLSLYVYAQGYYGDKLSIYRPPDFSTDITLYFDSNCRLDLSRSFYTRNSSHRDRTQRRFCMLQQKHSEENPFIQIICSDIPWEPNESDDAYDPEYECVNDTDMPSTCNTPPSTLETFTDAVEGFDRAAQSLFNTDIPAHVRASYQHI